MPVVVKTSPNPTLTVARYTLSAAAPPLPLVSLALARSLTLTLARSLTLTLARSLTLTLARS